MKTQLIAIENVGTLRFYQNDEFGQPTCLTQAKKEYPGHRCTLADDVDSLGALGLVEVRPAQVVRTELADLLARKLAGMRHRANKSKKDTAAVRASMQECAKRRNVRLTPSWVTWVAEALRSIIPQDKHYQIEGLVRVIL